MHTSEHATPALRLGLVLADPRHPFWAILGQSIQERAAQLGVALVIQSASTLAEQVMVLHSFAQQRISAVIVVPLATYGLGAGVAACDAANIPVIAVDMTITDARVTSTIRSDNRRGGALAATYLAERLNGHGKIVLLQGPLETESSLLRATGFQQALADFPAIKVVFESGGPLSRESGTTLMQQALLAHPDVRAVFATNDVIALGALDAIESRDNGAPVLVMGFDALVDSLTAIRTGRMVASVRQQPQRMAQIAVDSALAVLRHEPVPTLHLTGVDLVTTHNVLDAAFDVLTVVPGVLHTLGEQRTALANERTLLRTLIDTIPDLIYVKDTDSRFVLMNTSTAHLSGFASPDAVLGKTDADMHTPAMAARYAADERALFESGQPLINHEEPFYTSAGERLWMLSTKVPLHDAQGNLVGLVGVNRDITERKRIDAALRESEERYRLITDHTGDLISLFQHGRFVYASPSHRTVLGYDPHDLIGQPRTLLLHPDDAASLPRDSTQLAGHRPLHNTLRARHADGTWRWIETLLTTTVQGEQRFIVAVSRDITTRKQLEVQLLHAQKLESIGRLAGGIAHDFNNLLTAIAGYTELALLALSPDHPAHQDVREVARNAERAAVLTRQLLTFARRQPHEERAVNLCDLLADLAPMVRRLIGEHIVLHTHVSTEPHTVLGDQYQLEQVLMNLVVNARDAMPDGGTLTFAVDALAPPSDTTNFGSEPLPGDWVHLTIQDTGTGFSDEVQQHLFEPFFTTKPSGQGTGLGLATCYGIVKQHAGVITATSSPGQGATFHVYLPRVAAPLAQAQQVEVLAALPRGTETVLLVEDELPVRTFVARVLRDLGYTVIEAEHGAAALHLLHTCADMLVDALLTDVIMPLMNGPALAEQVQQIRPAIKVLFISGYTDSALAHYQTFDAPPPLLHKPFSPATLARRVRAVLDS